MSDDIIKKALGMDIVPVDDATVIEGEVVLHQSEDQVEMDFEYVCANLKELISQGQEAISELMLIAKQSQHPRAFEVIATLLKATADINNDLMATHKKKMDIKPTQTTGTKGINTGGVTNNLFVGSTAELQNFLEQMNNKKE